MHLKERYTERIGFALTTRTPPQRMAHARSVAVRPDARGRCRGPSDSSSLPVTPRPPQEPVVATYVPERVFDTRRRTFTDFEAMLADLARADVVLVGEQHDDPNTHRLEPPFSRGSRGGTCR